MKKKNVLDKKEKLHEFNEKLKTNAVKMAEVAQSKLVGKILVPCTTRPKSFIYIPKDQFDSYMSNYKAPNQNKNLLKLLEI